MTTFYTSVKGYEVGVGDVDADQSPRRAIRPSSRRHQRTCPAAWSTPTSCPTSCAHPPSGQIVATFEHALTSSLVLSASGVYTRSWDKKYPARHQSSSTTSCGNGRGRTPTTARSTSISSVATPSTAGILELSKRGRRFGYSGNITLARAYDTGSNCNSAPQDQRLGIESEWGPQADTPTRRGVVSGWYASPTPCSFPPSIARALAPPSTAVASGIDLNGDGNTGDRTPGFRRNSFRQSGQRALDLRFAWTLPFGSENKRWPSRASTCSTTRTCARS